MDAEDIHVRSLVPRGAAHRHLLFAPIGLLVLADADSASHPDNQERGTCKRRDT